jgi:hypothetical protein
VSTPEQRVGKRAEQKRRWDRENTARLYDQCSCGAQKLKRSEACQACSERQAASVRQGIVEMWAAGMTWGEIGRELGWTKNHLSAEIGRMRRMGYDLPHRRTLEQRTRIREGRWGKAA